MNKRICISFTVLCICAIFSLRTVAQNPLSRIPGAGAFSGGAGGGKGNDSLRHRTGLEDSITIRFRYLDTSRFSGFDSSINDFTKRFPIPYNYVFLGNDGSAARPIIYTPNLTSGWDPGFHTYDIYRLKNADTRFFNTTKPYTEIGYLIGSQSEQLVHALHTQNVTPDLNVALQFRLINSPGFFKNQNTNHSNWRVNSSYQSKRRRYHLYFIMLNNKIQNSDNGGIKGDQDYLSDLPTYKNRITIPIQLGNYVPPSTNPLDSKLLTGTRQKNFSFLLRQQYDLGKKDSVIVNDSTTTYLFYPKLRTEYTLQYNSYNYSFVDQQPDAEYYTTNYNFLQPPGENFKINEKWNEVINDFSLYSFPDTKNAQQFVKAGASLQNLTGTFEAGKIKYYNIFLHGEYRNKTKNKKWDIEAAGKFYLTGFNAGDYDALISLKRYISKKIGNLEAGFQNINRTPSFIFEDASSFSLGAQPSLNKENITRIFGAIEQPLLQLKLSANYYLISNYAYFKNYYQAEQEATLFNMLQIGAEKQFRLSKHWRAMAAATYQQTTGNVPLNVPALFIQGRINYEGNLGFKNLNIVFGIDTRYHTPYKADGYSPLLAQFYYQDQETVKLKFPDISGFLHFRIRSFTAYIRAENLNSVSFKDGFGFTNNNLAAVGYPYPGLQIRLGIFWSFVN